MILILIFQDLVFREKVFLEGGRRVEVKRDNFPVPSDRFVNAVCVALA